jgi:hypothetical protein
MMIGEVARMEIRNEYKILGTKSQEKRLRGKRIREWIVVYILQKQSVSNLTIPDTIQR